MADPLFETLQSKFGGAVEPGSGFRGEATVIVRKAQIVDVCTFLRDDPGLCFDSMRDLCGADYYRPDDRFEVIYNLYSIPHKRRLRLKVRIDEADMHVASVAGIWTTADWLERETYDMYGIIFDGHPDLRRIFMPEEFAYHPLRKDFPLMGIPGSLPLPHKQS
jgi:NADH-quinone oxidoreductase subunit C